MSRDPTHPAHTPHTAPPTKSSGGTPPAATSGAASGGGGDLTLATPIQFAPGVGPRRAELFARLDIATLADLIRHLPHRYEYHAGQSPIADLPIGAVGTARGTIVHCRWVPAPAPAPGSFGRNFRGNFRGRFTAQVRDDSGYLDLVWFNARYLRDKLHPGMELIVTAKVSLYRDAKQMANPHFRIVEPDEDGDGDSAGTPRGEHYRPIYPATEDLPSAHIERIVRRVLPAVGPQIDDHLDPAFRAERHLPELRRAYRTLHEPADEEEVAAARRRLAYDELLLLQLAFAVRRSHARSELRAPALRFSEAIDAHIRQRFPFTLTAAQDSVVREIAADLQRTVPMNRLLQGDVGSGKTVVALYALLMAVASNRQGALMAPTELLAEQHYLSIADMLAGSSVRLALLTGSLTGPERQHLLSRIERGGVDIVIGTHAMLGEKVRFADPAVVVIDEQHRFGVVQRAAIRSKAGDESRRAGTPHTLVMTATPIPRTLSLTIFGDLDISTIAEPPPGRRPITTRVVGPEQADEVYGYLARRVAKGEQAYIVLPAIDESEAGLKDARSHARKLERTHLAGRRLAVLHGRLKRRTRERIMHRFRRGEIDVLVATTVIEVGVDVPGAAMMVVEHAERFGLAQLHQLRGRVGRGARKSLCVFIAEPSTEEAAQRMKAIAKTTDGFAIAEKDLEIRGTGEMLGTKQSGLMPLRIAELPRHLDLLKLARRDAQRIVEHDPKLADHAHDLLRKRLHKHYGRVLGLADVG